MLFLRTCHVTPHHHNHHIHRPQFPHQTPTLKTLTLKTPTLQTLKTLAIKSPNPKPQSPLLEAAPFILPQWRPILTAYLCSSVSVLCLSSALSRLTQLPSSLSPQLLKEGLWLVGLAGVRAGTCYLQQALLWEAALGAVYAMRVHVFERVVGRDLGFFEGRDGVAAGDVAYRISAEAGDVADTIYALLNTVVPNSLQAVAMTAQMVTVSPLLSVIAALAIPCILLMVGYLGETLRRISRKASLSAARLSAYLNEVLPAMLAVKANVAELKETSRFQRLAHDNLLQLLKKRKMKVLIPQVVQALYVGGILLLCAISMVVTGSSCDFSRFCSFTMALTLLIEPIQGVGKAYNELKQGEPAIERLFDLTKFESKVVEKSEAVDLDFVEGDIRFSDVTFRYDDDMPSVLEGLNLNVRPGERVALVGPSGGGKTTLSKLLLRLYDPQCGSIFIDNHDIRDIKLRSLRKHVVMVSQESMLFSGTVAENIGYRDSIGQLNQARIQKAARIAHADEFIMALADGYETNIGQRGSVLSGGQKQRLAIARALYDEASILILDEATSALDSRSEMLVRQALEHLMTNRTVLIIAHRLETILMADRILVLDGGKLEEVSKSSLLALNNGQSNSKVLTELII